MKEALKLALEALQLVSIEFVCNGAHHAKKDRHDWLESCPIVERYQAAITAIKEALAQSEQPSFNEWTNAKLASHYFDLLKVVERYEKHGVTCQTFRHFVTEPCAECNCVAPITAIKEALAQPEQEPVEWPCVIETADFEEDTVTLKMQTSDYKVSAGKHWLSTTPPKRPWLGLTDAEMQALWDRYAHMEMMRAIEAKLKEKNT